MRIINSVDSISQIFHIEVYHISHFAILKYKIGEKLLLEQFAIFQNAFQFQNYLTIYDKINSKIIA